MGMGSVDTTFVAAVLFAWLCSARGRACCLVELAFASSQVRGSVNGIGCMPTSAIVAIFNFRLNNLLCPALAEAAAEAAYMLPSCAACTERLM